MKIAVIGRGFAGLSAAIILREKGYDVALVGPKSDDCTASTAAHGASTVKGLHEASQPLFALKLLGHREFPKWLKKIETLSKRRISKIDGVYERFSNHQEFKIEQDRIYKRRCLGAFALATGESERRVPRIGVPTLDDENLYWFRNFYPQDFWIDTTEYLDALDESRSALGVSVLTDRRVTNLVECDAHVTVCCENDGDKSSFVFDAVVVAAGAGIETSLGDRGSEGGPRFFAAPGYTARISQVIAKNHDFCAVKELSAVAQSGGYMYLGSTTEANGVLLEASGIGIERLLEQKKACDPRGDFSKLYHRVLGVSPTQTEFELFWGVRVRTRDRIPVVGPLSARRRIFINTGYYKSGLTLTPLGGAFLASLIAGEPLDPKLRILDIARTRIKT